MTLFDAANAEVLPPLSDRARAAARQRAHAWTRRTFVRAVLCLLVVAIVAGSVWPLTGTVVPWDSKNQFYDTFRFLGAALRDGVVPLWNPYQFGGSPAVADPQSLIFTPTMLLFAALVPNATMSVFDAVIFAHLAAGAIGILGLARRWRWHPAAGLLAALVYMLGGAASSRLHHTGMIISYAWFPLAFWSLQAALDRRSVRLAAVAGLCATCMAIGRDQVAFLMCMALAGAVLRQAFRSNDWLGYLKVRAPLLLTAGLAPVVLLAVPVLLTLQFLHDSNRPGIPFGIALVGSLDPINLLTLVAPNVFGSLDRTHDYWGPGGHYTGTDWTDSAVDYLFIGTLPVVLLVWHGLVGGRLLERGARYFAIVLVVALIYAFGRHTALFGLIYDWVPGVALYRRPADASFLVNIALAVLAGYLLHRYVEEGPPRVDLQVPRRAVPAILTSLCGAWVIGAGLTFARQSHHVGQSAQTLAIAALAAAGVFLLLALCRSPRHRRWAAALLVAATAVQLVWHNAGSALNAEPVERYAANASLPPDQAQGLAVLRQDLAAHSCGGVAPRVEVQGIDGPWQNASLIYRLQNLAGYNPLRVAAYEKAVGVAESTNDPRLRSFPDTFRGYNSRLAAMLGLGYLVIDRPLTELPLHYPRPRGTLIFHGVHFDIYRLDNVIVPRVHFAARLLSVDSDTVIDAGDIPDFDLIDEALVDDADTPKLKNQKLLVSDIPSVTSSSDLARRSHAEIQTYGDNRIVVSTDSLIDGLLVLHDVYYPGWVATIDGHSAPILRTDLLFRGVEVPAGRHRVEFTFRPFSPANLLATLRIFGRRDE